MVSIIHKNIVIVFVTVGLICMRISIFGYSYIIGKLNSTGGDIVNIKVYTRDLFFLRQLCTFPMQSGRDRKSVV